MATKNRPGFLRVALRCFCEQTRPNAELIVVDDSEHPVAELCAGMERVRYIRLDEPTLLGTKLNIGIEASSGPLIQKLDDDDYYHPRFLETSAGNFPTGRPADTIVAWDCFLVLHPREGQLRYSGHGWKAGGTLLFSRELWRRTPFRAVPRSVDSWLLKDSGAKVIPVCAPEEYILVRHGSNTWTQMQGGLTADEFLQTRNRYKRPLAELVNSEALAYYESLAATAAAG